MKLHQILIEQELKKSSILCESITQDMSSEQRYIVENIYNEFLPLIETTLTVDQVKQIFGNIEQELSSAGGNRSLIGAGVDVAKQANDTINKIGKWLQDTTPVKNFDAKFEKLKDTINKKYPDSKILDAISNMAIWAKENPGKTAAIIGVLTAIASLAAGPVGGAVAGQILRGSLELLKGEKLSTAIGKGIKTAALGYLSGKAFEVLGKFIGGMRADAIPVPGAEQSGLADVSYGATRTLTAPGFSSKEMVQGFNVRVFPQEAEAINNAMSMIKNGQAGGFDALQKIAREINSDSYSSAIADITANTRAAQLANDGLLNWINGLSQAGQALSQGAVAASGAQPKQESVKYNKRPLSEGQVYLVFNRVEQLCEGPIWDKVKAGAGKVAGAVAKGAQAVGHQLTTDITAAKLYASWKIEGSPTDSEQLAKFLQGQNVDPKVVDKVYTGLKLKTAGEEPAADSPAAQATYKEIKAMVLKLDKKGKQRIAKYLQGQLGIA